MVGQLKRQVRRTFNWKRNAIWMSIQFKIGKQRVSLNAKVSAMLLLKREKRFVEVHLRRKSSKIISSHFSSPTGSIGYCNYIMAMLYEIAHCSLHSLKSFPLELACTSKIKQWGVSSQNYCRKAPVMKIIIQKREKLQGITCTLYDPRRNKDATVLRKSTMDWKAKLQSKDSRIGSSHCYLFMENDKGTRTDFDVFAPGSTVAQQLNVVEFDIKFLWY